MFDFKDGLRSLLNQISQGMDPTISSLLTQTPAGKYPDAYRTVTNIATTAVKPVAMTVLAVQSGNPSCQPGHRSGWYAGCTHDYEVVIQDHYRVYGCNERVMAV
mgnify:CR=1 FL=1